MRKNLRSGLRHLGGVAASQPLVQTGDSDVKVRQYLNDGDRMGVSIGQDGLVDPRPMAASFNILHRQRRTFGFPFARSLGRGIEGAVQVWSRVRKLNGVGALVDAAHRVLRLAYGGRSRNDLDPAPLIIRVPGNLVTEQWAQFIQHRIHCSLEQPCKGAKRLIEQVGLVLNQEAWKWVKEALFAIGINRKEANERLSTWGRRQRIPRFGVWRI